MFGYFDIKKENKVKQIHNINIDNLFKYMIMYFVYILMLKYISPFKTIKYN